MPMRGSYALQLKNISFHYGQGKQNKIVDQLNFHVNRGEFVSIVGASGSGKSTLFRLIVGLEQPQYGKIAIEGKVLKNRLGYVGYMPQKDLLMPWRTIRQNASLALEIKKKHDDERIDHLLAEFGLRGYENKYPHELSGGMRQRVSFLRATLSGADLLLLDEPFSALDAMTKLFMQEWLLDRWIKYQSTILFITHDISEAIFLSDRIFVVTETPIEAMEEFIVPLGRPRRRDDLNKEEIINLQKHLMEKFRARVYE